MMRPLKYLLVVAFFGVLLLPIVAFDMEDSIYAKGELPSSFSRKAPRDFENWFSTRLGLNALRLQIGALLNFGILKRSTSPLVEFGKDNWLFTADSGDMSGPPPRISDFRGSMRLSSKAIAQINDTLTKDQKTLKACGISFVALVAPNKQSIYGEYLATRGWPTETRLTNMIANLNADAKAVVEDPRREMIDFKTAHPDLPLYYATGSHWTDMGAWVAYKQMVDRLTMQNAIFAPERALLENFDVKVTKIDGVNMDLVVRYAKGLFIDFDTSLISKVPSMSPTGRVPHELIAPAGFGQTEYVNPAGRGRLLYMGDSFGAKIVPLLARHFKTADYMDFPFITTDIIAKFKPDVVVLETIERNLEKWSDATNLIGNVCP